MEKGEIVQVHLKDSKQLVNNHYPGSLLRSSYSIVFFISPYKTISEILFVTQVIGQVILVAINLFQ